MTTAIIAELGSNPAAGGWNFETWCAVAAQNGATHVKVQVFYATHFPQEERASKYPLEFPRGRLKEFATLAREYRLIPGASVFDPDAVRKVAEACDFLKLAAREQNSLTLLANCLDTRRPIFRSIAALGMEGCAPSTQITHLRTIPNYPTPRHVALWELVKTARYFKLQRLPWGWSSHTTSIWDSVLAAKLGACVVEKHLSMCAGDIEAGHSLTPDQFGDMTRRING